MTEKLKVVHPLENIPPNIMQYLLIVHKNSPLASMLKRMDTVQNFTQYFLRCMLVLSLHILTVMFVNTLPKSWAD
jgi:hypothetical protein